MAIFTRKTLTPAAKLAAKAKTLRDTEAAKIASAEALAHAADVAAGHAQVAATQATAVEQAVVITENAQAQIDALLSEAGVTL